MRKDSKFILAAVSFFILAVSQLPLSHALSSDTEKEVVKKTHLQAKDDLDQYYGLARMHYSKDNSKAAMEMRNAADYLKASAEKAAPGKKAALEESEKKLRAAAEKVERGGLQNLGELKEVFKEATATVAKKDEEFPSQAENAASEQGQSQNTDQAAS